MKVSVLITSYNQSALLREAVISVLMQTMRPYEILICDDGSSDDSPSVIDQFSKLHPELIKGYIRPQNLGISSNRNFAIQKAKGDWIVFLDGDDRFLPRKLEASQSTLNENPSSNLVFSDYYYINEKGKRTGRWTENLDSIPPSGGVFEQVFCKEYPRRSLFRNELMNLEAVKQNGLFDTEMKIYEDWEFRLRFAAENRLAYCAEPLSEYRLHSGGISRLPTTVHVNYIRSLFLKNANLLEDFDDASKQRILSKFLLLESGFSNSACKQLLKSLNILELIECLNQKRKFVRTAHQLLGK